MISVTDPIQRSIDWTRKVLFSPFDLGKWCAMGFTAFPASLLSGPGFNYQSRNPFSGFKSPRVHRPPLAGLEEARVWVLAHVALVAVIGVLALAFVLLVQWLGARGQFMFLDNVVNDRAKVLEPWQRYREHGNRVFLFLLVLNLATLAVVAGGLWLGWRVAGPGPVDFQFGLPAIKGILAALGVILPLGFLLAMTGLVLRDFVIPIMYLRGVTAPEGFGVFWREVMPGHGGSFVGFYFMKLLLSIAAAVVILLGTCLTCCLAGLPYVSAVVFLPVHVFFRSYSLSFMAQCGEAWRMVPEGSGH
jgi:hypothetical protein